MNLVSKKGRKCCCCPEMELAKDHAFCATTCSLGGLLVAPGNPISWQPQPLL